MNTVSRSGNGGYDADRSPENPLYDPNILVDVAEVEVEVSPKSCYVGFVQNLNSSSRIGVVY